MNVVTIGSCMSEGVVSALRRNSPLININHINHVIHNRSDYFLNCFVQEKMLPVIPEKVLDGVDVCHSDEFPGRDLRAEAQFFLDNQSLEKIGVNRVGGRRSFISNLSECSVDIFILDNFMDIASMLACEKNSSSRYFVFSGAFSAKRFDSIYRWSDNLSAEESLQNWIDIIKWLRNFQPNSKVFFAPFPAKVYLHDDRPSVVRAANFKKLLEKNHFPAIILNTFDVSHDLMKSDDDWCHYSPVYYEHVADLILKSI